MLTRRTQRRSFALAAGIGVVVIAGVLLLRLSPTNAESRTTPSGRSTGGIIAPATSTRPAMVNPSVYQYPVVLTRARWKKRLTAQQFFILREKSTEPPFSGQYDHFNRPGIYYSAATGQPLFSSRDKFDSGTGWPSFTKPINPKAVVLAVDNSDFMQRVEVEDSLSGSHLGHVFNDGPPPTGKRYCIDSAALIFVPTGGSPPRILAPNNPLSSKSAAAYDATVTAASSK